MDALGNGFWNAASSVDLEGVDEAAVGADEGVGGGVLPLGLHACGAGGLEAEAPSVELVALAVMALQVAAIDLDARGGGKQRPHGRSILRG